jgi:predicted O-methyltransferase YrrM
MSPPASASPNKTAQPPLSLWGKAWREVARPFRKNKKKRATSAFQRVAVPGLATFDPQSCTVEPEGLALLTRLVKESARLPGPIIEVGTLLGITATHMALVKRPEQKIITVDNYCWNPWHLPPDAHHALARQILHYLIETAHVQQVRMDKAEFYASYKGPAPALVFLDAWHTYEETKKDIEWAQRVGARLIAGHDYCDQFPGVQQIVDECGGARELGGTVWVLRSEFTARRAQAA